MRSTRATSIGYGTRKDFRAQKSDSTVSPNAYHVDKYHEMNEKRKHLTLRKRLSPLQDTSRNNPGPGEYNIGHSSFMKEYPILIRSRRVFYYSNDLKNSNPTVSPQSYKPKIETVQESRFKKIGIGYGNKTMPYNKDALLELVVIIYITFLIGSSIRKYLLIKKKCLLYNIFKFF